MLLWLSLSILLVQPASSQLTQTQISGPVGSGPGAFGQSVVFLPNGNYVVSDPEYDLPTAVNAGAVHLYRGSDDELLATLTGTGDFDVIGRSFSSVSGVIVLPSGNYLVRADNWDDARGAVTWCDGDIGCSGVVSATNSVVGSSVSDFVGGRIHVLANGDYLVVSSEWDDPAGPAANVGAVRLCDGDTGCFGPVTSANALIGSSAGLSAISTTELTNGNYVVGWMLWGTPSMPEVGAVTFCNGAIGCVGTVSAANSLVGTTGGDWVGMSVTPLSDGNFVVQSPRWSNGALISVGAVTWCSGTVGCPAGPVTPANSLTGTSLFQIIGGDVLDENGPTPVRAVSLPGGGYVIESPVWSLPGFPSSLVGAVTWCGPGGVGCNGATVSTANSLVGSTPLDLRRGGPIVAVGSGAFVVPAPEWNNPASGVVDVGAAVYCDSVTHCQGQTIGASNALIGSTSGAKVGSQVTALVNGHYVVDSPGWSSGGFSAVGAATFCSGTVGCQGPVTSANSFTGASALDSVASGRTVALSNGNYVVLSPFWNSGALGTVGAVTLCSGTTGCLGTPSPLNSFVGRAASDFVGSGGVVPLPSGQYLVVSPNLDEGQTADVGAVTLCSGTIGCVGPATSSNSLLGIQDGDRVGDDHVALVSDERFVVKSRSYDGGLTVDAGAVTFGDGATATVGRVDATNSVIGSVSSALLNPATILRSQIAYDPVRERFAVGIPKSHRVVLAEVPEPGTGMALVAGSGWLGLLARRRRSGGP